MSGLALDELLDESTRLVFERGGPPSTVMLGKPQLRSMVPYWAKNQAGAVMLLYNKGFRGESLKLSSDESWRLR